MPRTRDLARLFRAVASGDLDGARVLAAAIADHEVEAGRPGAAATLRKALVTTNGVANPTAAVTRMAPDVLTRLPVRSLGELRLTAEVRSSLGSVLREYQRRDVLRQHGLEPRDRLFLHGPPGCGKTATACALAGELGLPIFVVRFDALLGSYLGQTSARMHEVFRFASENPSVVLIDEIDAIGRRRGFSSDIAELDRVVISLMQQLDLLRPAGLLVAASNLPEDIDPALVRRFDLALELPAPGRCALMEFSRTLAERRGVSLVNGVQQSLADASTFAEVERIVVSEQRRILMRGH